VVGLVIVDERHRDDIGDVSRVLIGKMSLARDRRQSVDRD
jgi:hypothetical protein